MNTRSRPGLKYVIGSRQNSEVERFEENLIKINHSPGSDEKTVTVTYPENRLIKGELVVVDMNGKEMMRRKAPGMGNPQVSLPKLRKGIYLIYFQSAEGKILDQKRMLVY